MASVGIEVAFSDYMKDLKEAANEDTRKKIKEVIH